MSWKLEKGWKKINKALDEALEQPYEEITLKQLQNAKKEKKANSRT